MNHQNDEVLLEVSNLETHFFTRHGIIRAVDGVSLYVHKGEAVGIVGESGCGKSMTARSILQLVPSPPGKIVGGKIIFESRNLLGLKEDEVRKVRGSQISVVFQDPMTFLNPVMSIGSQVDETIRLHLGLKGQELHNYAINALRQARVPSPETAIHSYPHQLSGGMRQRILIAMAIACSPKLLIADEPTTALDVTIQAQIIQLLKDVIAELGMSLLLVTHDLGVIADVCDRVYVMYAGQIVEHASAEDLFNNPKHPYTQGLLNSITRITEKVTDFRTIKGSVPDLLSPPVGCKFHPRCPYVMAICKEIDPAKGIQEGEVACWLYQAPETNSK